MRDFKRLEIWRRAHALVIALYKATAGYGRLGYGHLRSQLMRAADSIKTNIAEGCGTDSNRELARFLDMSIKSSNETENHLISVHDLELMPREQWLRYSAETVEIRKMTYAYRQKVLEDDEEL
ncbi:MAG TPA: four helix bundle protein [Gemmatimonadaceae bacterium]|jgi:four helix bundle protein|nr:four helix bundle protein [Gemmatimonadaceae bacterium]